MKDETLPSKAHCNAETSLSPKTVFSRTLQISLLVSHNSGISELQQRADTRTLHNPNSALQHAATLTELETTRLFSSMARRRRRRRRNNNNNNNNNLAY
jgi:hypothetical protein